MIKNLHFTRSLTRSLAIAALAIFMFLPGRGWGQLLQQDFSSSTTVSSYVSATPSNGQFTQIGTSGAGSTVTATGNKLNFTRVSGNTYNFNRSVGFSPAPASLMVKFDVTVSGNSVATASSEAQWYFGTSTATNAFADDNTSPSNANTYCRLGIGWTATAGQWNVWNSNTQTGGAANVYTGTQTITWVINNSGATLSYRAPNGTNESVANDLVDIWVGNTKEFNDVAVTTGSITAIDKMKFILTGSANGTITIDNILIDPIPAIPASGTATNITSSGFRANWTAVTGVTGYRVDVSTASDFSSFVSGYDNLAVSGQGTNYVDVTGLNASTPYYYRVRAESAYTVGTFTSGNSASQNPTTSSSTSAPTVTASAATSISETSATFNGNITADGGAAITERGFCYKTTAGVAITDNKTAEGGTATGAFTKAFSSLGVNTQYFYRAYATNSVNTTLSASDISFYTLANVPDAPTVNNPTTSTLDVAVNVNGNPSSTEFAIYETSTGNYVQADGTLGATAVWQTATTWGTKTVTGLSASTPYTFEVNARNGANVETGFGSTAGGTTSDAVYAITFYVDMSNAGSFTTVDVAGDFNSWAGNAMTLVSNNIYTFTTTASFSAGNTITFKFRKDGGATWEQDPNRTYTVVAGANNYYAVWNVMVPAKITFANIQSPATATILLGASQDVYARVYAQGLTGTQGDIPNLQVWIGYSTTNTNPNTWTNWVLASYNADFGNNEEYKANLGAAISTPGTYYYASRFKLGVDDYLYGGCNTGFWDGTTNISGVLTVNAPQLDWANLQSPATGSITLGGNFDVYAQVYEPGVTPNAGQGANITAWIGYSVTNDDPATGSGWTWVSASYNSLVTGQNDEYFANIGTTLPAGTYYYASRFKMGLADYVYGGYNIGGGGFWDNSTNISGVLTVTTPTITITGTITGFGNQAISTVSAEKSYAVSGANLISDIVITPPAGFLISTTSGSGYSSSPITLTQSGGTVASTAIYVVFNPTAAQAYSGNITHASTGATPQNVAVTGTGICAAAAFPFVENFDYAASSLLTANCWTAHSGTGGISVTGSSIAYPGYLSSGVGNEVPLSATLSEDDNRTFTAQTSGTIYASFLVNVASVNTTGDYFFHVGQTAIGTTFRGRVFVKSNTSNKIAFGIAQSATAVYTSFNYDPNTTYLVVLKYDIVTGAANDVSSIYINPTLNAVIPSSGWLTNTDAAGTDLTELGSVALRQASGGISLKLDGIRISNNWADIVGAIPVPTIASFTPGNACAGSGTSVTITGTGFTGGNASVQFNGTTATSITVNSASEIIAVLPAGATTGPITVTTAGGTATSSSNLIVNPLPVAPTSAAVDVNDFCANATGDISLSVPDGSGTTLGWYTSSCGGTLVGTGTPLVIAKPTATTTYYARWENSCGNSDCAFVLVTVHALPTVNSIAGGATSVCVNSMTDAFTNATTGGTWSITPGTGSAGITAGGIVTGLTAGNVTVVYTVNDVTCSNSASAALTVKALPVVDAGLQGYPGINIPFQMNGTVTSGASVVWTQVPYDDGVGTLNNYTIINPLFTGTKIGSIKFKLTATLDGCLASDSVILVIFPNEPTIWRGGTTGFANDWEEPGNWLPASLPISTTDVLIPSDASYFPVIGTTPANCRNITIASGASITGNENLTISGTATVEVALTRGVYHSYSPSVTGAKAGNVFYAPPMNVYVYSHNELNNTTYGGYAALTGSDVLLPMAGYSVIAQGSGTYTFSQTGTLNKGPYSRTNLSRTGTGPYAGFNYVGNPYPSYIDWNSASMVKSNLSGAIYIENEGNWATYPYLSEIGTNAGTNIIAPGQGFFVEVQAPNTTGSLSMNPTVRTNSPTTPYLKSASASSYVRLVATGNAKTDETVVRFAPEATPQFDSQYDALKMEAGDPDYPQIYSISDKKLSYNALPETGEVQLGFTAKTGSYTIGINALSGLSLVTLEDTKTGIFTILDNSTYAFDFTAGENENRFILHFGALAVKEDKNATVSIYSYQQTVHINMKDQEKGYIYIYNIAGQLVATKLAAQGTIEIRLPNMGNYIVKVISRNTTQVRKVFIQ